jgi:hypothetical protein
MMFLDVETGNAISTEGASFDIAAGERKTFELVLGTESELRAYSDRFGRDPRLQIRTGRTSVRFELIGVKRAGMQLRIHDLLGRTVYHASGKNALSWDYSSMSIAGGSYIAIIQASGGRNGKEYHWVRKLTTFPR